MQRQIILIVVTLITLLTCSTAQAKLLREGEWIFSITDEITTKDSEQIKNALQSIDTTAKPLFSLNSPGGDIYAAMEIGRLLRKVRATCIVPVDGQCSSACVLVLVGAVERSIYGKIAIHRPYSTYVGKRDYKNTEKEYRRTEMAVRIYLKDMNFTENLVDAMLQVPPEQARILSRKESVDFGLIGIDPVEQEVRDAALAAIYGISKQEYLYRKIQVDEACPLPLKEPSLPEREQRWQCQEAFMYGISVEVYKARKARADTVCSTYKSDSGQFWTCAHAVFRGEK